MEIGEAVGRYEQAAALLPSRWQQAARRVPEHRKAQAEEFRLRAGRPMTLLTCEGELLVSDELPRQSVTQADLEQLCDAVTGYSRYAAAETMGKGYLIGRGGFRIGLCGTVAVRGDGGTALRDISSAVVRISRQVRGLWQEVPEWSVGGFDSTLIAAPPGGGKTTLLRDMIATLSNGTEDRCPLRVGVVDERGELAGMYRGVPQLDVGCHTDVLDGCPKALGIPMLLRSANPQVIAVDEITEAADILAMTAAANCGVKPAGHDPRRGRRRAAPQAAVPAAGGGRRLSPPHHHQRIGWSAALPHGGPVTAAAGAVLVLSAAILALRRYYARQRRCRDLLWSFAVALGEMESAIRWQRTPVLPLLEMLQTREHCGVWFCQIRDKVQSDMTLQLAWENTFHQLSDTELRDLLCRISWSGDAQRLESTIARARAEAEQLYEKRREADRHSRSVTTTATLCGAGLMIILLL